MSICAGRPVTVARSVAAAPSTSPAPAWPSPGSLRGGSARPCGRVRRQDRPASCIDRSMCRARYSTAVGVAGNCRSASSFTSTAVSSGSSGAPMWTTGSARSRDRKSGSVDRPVSRRRARGEEEMKAVLAGEVEEMEQRLLIADAAIDILDNGPRTAVDRPAPLAHRRRRRRSRWRPTAAARHARDGSFPIRRARSAPIHGSPTAARRRSPPPPSRCSATQ